MRLSIAHPLDPWAQGLGGFSACIDGVMRYAPDSWDLEFIGATSDPEARPPGRWNNVEFSGRKIRFFPALVEAEPNRVQRMPLSLRFVFACRAHRVRPSGDIVQFHRPESGYAMRLAGRQQSAYFIHNHPGEVIPEFSDVRWRRLGWLFNRVLWDRLHHADTIVTVDPRTRSWLSKISEEIPQRTYWLPQWADAEYFHSADHNLRDRDRIKLRKSADLPLDRRVIGFAGRLEIQKDPMLLLNAFGQISTRRRDTALVFVGAGRMEKNHTAMGAIQGISGSSSGCSAGSTFGARKCLPQLSMLPCVAPDLKAVPEWYLKVWLAGRRWLHLMLGRFRKFFTTPLLAGRAS